MTSTHIQSESERLKKTEKAEANQTKKQKGKNWGKLKKKKKGHDSDANDSQAGGAAQRVNAFDRSLGFCSISGKFEKGEYQIDLSHAVTLTKKRRFFSSRVRYSTCCSVVRLVGRFVHPTVIFLNFELFLGYYKVKCVVVRKEWKEGRKKWKSSRK